MRIHEGLDGLRRLDRGATASIGNFDGLHLGHARILGVARALRERSASGRLAVVTFEPHPLTVLRPTLAPPRLTPPDLKRELLAAAGVDDLVVLPPVPDVLNLSAEAFWALLRDEVRPAALVEGGSFTFGKGRRGTIEKLREWSAGSGIELHVVEPVHAPMLDLRVAPVSSSLIRWLLVHGRARDAAICLGRPYTLKGSVVAGFQRGRTIGYPTANLDCGELLIPADGVYVARCTLQGRTWPIALSVGTAPTFGKNPRQVEAYLVGFAGDLYGQTLRVELIDWIRGQLKLPNLAALQARMAIDVEYVQERYRINPAEPIAISRDDESRETSEQALSL